MVESKSSSQRTHSPEFIKCLSDFFKRELISIPLIKQYPHQAITQRCNLKAATLELDTAAYPSIEYVAGTRLSVYAPNCQEHVSVILKHVTDDMSSPSQQQQLQKTLKATSATNTQTNTPVIAAKPTSAGPPPIKRAKLDDNWSKFVQMCGHDSLRLALTHLYDITTAPSRLLIQIMAENCSQREHKSKLFAIAKTDDTWEKWICHSQRSLKSTLEEFSSCQMLASVLISELNLQQPRQYSISSIKSSKRFRAEIIVFQHKFTPKQIENNLNNVKEREQIARAISPAAGRSLSGRKPEHSDAITQSATISAPTSMRSVRSVTNFAASPISTHQVSKVPSYSGPLMNIYATSTLSAMSSAISSTLDKPKSRSIPKSKNDFGAKSSSSSLAGIQTRSKSTISGRPNEGATRSSASLLSQAGTPDSAAHPELANRPASSSSKHMYDGLCSNYLLNLKPNEHILCEFVENPRFTLKGNRERPIMMIGQDVGLVAFKPFWQQRSLEHDRAQTFYSLFKDLAKKTFGDMQLVCLTGNRCKIEDLFKRELNHVLAHKILSSVCYINRSLFVSLLDVTMIKSNLQQASQIAEHIQIDSNELIDLGNRIYKLLIENNGCLYTCCDPQMTQAIEILTVESIARNNASLTRDRVMALLPHWKGRDKSGQKEDTETNGNGNKYLYTLENQFEKAQIVQEIYDSSI